MDLNLLIEKIKNNNFANNFLKELRECMEKLEVPKDNANERLTSKEQRLFEREKFKIYEGLEDCYFVVHSKYSNDDRIKIEQCKNNQSILKVIHESDLQDSNVNIGDIIKKVDLKYVVDREKTQEIEKRLEELRESIKSKKDFNN